MNTIQNPKTPTPSGSRTGGSAPKTIGQFLVMLKSPGLLAVWQWSESIHRAQILICLISVAGTLCSLGVTLTTKGLIDGAVSSRLNNLIRYGLVLAALVFGQRLLSFGGASLRIKTSARLQRTLQGMMLEQILAKDYSGIKKYHSGELVNRVFSDVDVVRSEAINLLPNLAGIAVSFFGASAILISMDWRFVILLIIAGIMSLALSLAFRKPMKSRHRRMREAEGAMHASIQETLENIRLIKASVSEDKSLRHVGMRQESYQNEQIRQSRFSLLMSSSMGIVFDASWLVCMLWGCLNIYRGNMTYGSLAAMIQLIGRIQGPISNAIHMAGRIYSVIASAERLLEITELPEEEEGEVLTDFDDLFIENVSFRYDDGDEDVLSDISCAIHKGDFMAFTGVSGGGKTSLFQLLLGIYRPTGGKITFQAGGKEIPASRATRRLFAYVPQGNTLLSGTLRDNLTQFIDHADDEEIMAAAKAACIDHLVKDIGLDAPIGERGFGLSEGQGQRVAIARALLTKAPILLLDESTSALDEETEARLLANISAMRDKTCIIVTHRKAALSICDYRLHFHEGKTEKTAAS